MADLYLIIYINLNDIAAREIDIIILNHLFKFHILIDIGYCIIINYTGVLIDKVLRGVIRSFWSFV